jgi:hypothetical protein
MSLIKPRTRGKPGPALRASISKTKTLCAHAAFIGEDAGTCEISSWMSHSPRTRISWRGARSTRVVRAAIGPSRTPSNDARGSVPHSGAGGARNDGPSA